MEWGGGPEPHAKGFLCAEASAGQEHQERDQAHTKTAGASGRDRAGNHFLGRDKLPRSSFQLLLEFIPIPSYTPLSSFQPFLSWAHRFGSMGNTGKWVSHKPLSSDVGLLVQVSLHTLSHPDPPAWGLMIFKCLSGSGVSTVSILLAWDECLCWSSFPTPTPSFQHHFCCILCRGDWCMPPSGTSPSLSHPQEGPRVPSKPVPHCGY